MNMTRAIPTTLTLFDNANAGEPTPATIGSARPGCLPRYLADFEQGDVVMILDRWTGIIKTMLFADWRTMTWALSDMSLGMEAAHGARYSPRSKSQRWTSEQNMRDFYALCATKRIALRFLPEKSMPTLRKYAGLDKSGTNDLLAWDAALTVRPRLWDCAQRPENLGSYLDPREDQRERTMSHTKHTAGLAYRAATKEAALILSAADDEDAGDKYRASVPGQRAYTSECLQAVRARLEAHTSDVIPNGEGIQFIMGVSTYVYPDGTSETISLSEIMRFPHRGDTKFPASKIAKTQYVACMMLLLNEIGQRHLNLRTGAPMGFRDIKQYGIVSSGFHLKPGFLRPKFYHHGIKGIVKRRLETRFGLHTVADPFHAGSTKRQAAIDWMHPEHQAYFHWLRNACRIAYEQTTKGMIGYLNTASASTLFDVV